MAFGIAIKIWGEYACFTRPEMKVERVSYDIITPSACRGILEAIYWKPEIKWVIDKIHVLKPIRFVNIRRNEIANKISFRNAKTAMTGGNSNLQLFIEDSRQQRASLILKDVEYIIEAHFETLTGDNTAKHKDIFVRRAKKGQCFNQPYMGVREFPAFFVYIEPPFPKSPLKGEKDLGWTLYDMDFENGIQPLFYKPIMKDGVIDLTNITKEELKR